MLIHTWLGKVKTILIVFLLLLTSACSYRGMYESIRISRQYECSKFPPSVYDDCMKDMDQSYEQYERERRDL
jgi:hypothetical protein